MAVVMPHIDATLLTAPAEKLRLFDSHCHLHSEAFADDRDAVVERAQEFGIQRILLIGAGSGMTSNHAAIALQKKLLEKKMTAYCSIGLHPHDAKLWSPTTVDELKALQAAHQPVAWGEIGLDYHYNFASKEEQWRCFEQQLQLAADFKLPFIIHNRESDSDMQRILQNHRTQIQQFGGIMHCFSGGARLAEGYLDLGMHLSYAGVITFAKSIDLHEAVNVTPLNRLLIETDAPYLTPVPFRGKRNEPACVYYTAEKIAALKQLPPHELASITFENTSRLLKTA